MASKAGATGNSTSFFGSIGTRFTLSFAIMIAAALLLINTYFLTYSRNMIFETKRMFIRSQASIIESALADLDGVTVSSVARVMGRLDVSAVTIITVQTPGGAPVYTGMSGNEQFPPNAFTAEHMQRALWGYDITLTRFANGEFITCVLMPVIHGDSVVALLFVGQLDRAQGAIMMSLQSTIRFVSMLIIALSAVGLSIFLWTVMRRITMVQRAITKVREGEYSYKIEAQGRDELGALGREFNTLTDRLRETEERRRHFVADASHELKTPLASIRLLSDSILQNSDIPPETVREFVADIGDESERLARTTEKLLALTRLDARALPDTTYVDVAAVVRSALRMLQPLAANAGVTLETRLDDRCRVYATTDALRQVIVNLVENAIKYNVPQGSVIISLWEERHTETQSDEFSSVVSTVVLRVEDTGIGVPEEDLPYIFERFYRVDKARSRATGGSGLGLSIVRDTVREYGGTVTATRRPGGGMRMDVAFSIDN
ncbi:MAG: HAMP domain-containing histidine kinase [Oscillospiraceae bacterium]|nr:HAMP domain-containing histidine kinase [Oscillospiraceae bacterium]